MVKCLICKKYEEEAKRLSHNGQVYAAHVIRCDGIKKLQDVVDHLCSPSHAAAITRRDLEEKWKVQPPSHPWIKVIDETNSKNLERLIHLFANVHNDSNVLAQSAASFPSRELTHMAGNSLVCQYN